MADTKVGGAFVDLFVKDDKFNQDMAKGESRLAKFGKRAGKAARQVGAALGAALASFAAFSFKALGEQELAESKLEQVLRATGEAAGFSAGEMKKQAQELQNLTTFGDEAVIELQTLIATFREIKGSQFVEATGLALDMAILFGDTKAAAIQLGKALNDPIKGIAALNRVGVTFSKEQEKQIRNAQEQGDIAKAQGVILEELKNQFGGVAAAAADNISGRFAQLKNSFSDMGESFARIFGGGEGGLADLLLKVRIQIDMVSEAFLQMSQTFKGIGEFFGKIKRSIEGIAAFLGALSGGASIKEAVAAAKSIPDELATERKRRFDETKAASAAGQAKLAALRGLVPGAGGAEAEAQAKQSAKAPSFTSFQNAIKNTQSLQAKKSDETKIKLAKQSLKAEQEMLSELEKLNLKAEGSRSIVTV